MQYTRADIVRHFSATSLSRGEAYFREGKCIRVTIEGDGLKGEVSGTGGKIYRQTVHCHPTRAGSGFDSMCTCPVQTDCKHVVAALLAFLPRAKALAEGSFVPNGADAWLRELEQLKRDARDSAEPMLYVLIPDQRRSSLLRLYLGRNRTRKGDNRVSLTLYTDYDSLLGGRPGSLLPADEEAIRLMAGLRAGGYNLDSVTPAGAVGWRLLEQACARGQLAHAASVAGLKRGEMTFIGSGPARPARLAWREHQPYQHAAALGWIFDDDGTAVDQLLPTEPMAYLHDGRLGELVRPEALAGIAPAELERYLAHAPSLQPHERAGVAARMVKIGLDRILPLPQAPQLRQRRGIKPVPVLELDSALFKVRRDYVVLDMAELCFSYNGQRADFESPPVLSEAVGGAVELIERDLQVEQAARVRLAGFGFEPAAPDSPLGAAQQLLTLPTRAAWLDFIRRGKPQLEAEGWEFDYGPGYRYDLVEAEDWYAELSEEGEGGNAWFSLELGILVQGKRHALLPLLVEMIRDAPTEFTPAALAARADASEVMVELGDSTPVVLPWTRVKPILAVLGELYFTERIGRALRLPWADAARLAELEHAAQLRWLGGERVLELGRRMADFDGIRPVAPPAGLQATLREYQRAGLAWMQFLRDYGFAGILADDMGLGKTIQTLAHILVEKEAGRLDAPALVVAPTSLMSNWQAEAARFAPGLRVLLLHGKDRKEGFDAIGGADLVLTTYALLGRDEPALRKQGYHLLILDEAQYIKNPKSKAAQTVRLLDARHRLCLTGTPVQNHLGELWSQFHFLMPGLLGDEKTFNAEFRRPIEQEGDSLRRELLARRIKPFMLRRTKDKVATELPPKTEIVLPVDFGSAQRDLYETVRVAMDRKVRDEIDRKGLARSQIVILDALLKLRQVCCDPRLIRPADEGGSAKLDTLMELLDTLLEEGRRVLVFSQFTSMLELIEFELRRREIPFVLLTGDTEDRAAPVAAFQAGQVPVFLISLKAGGVGLNLTAADTVIHYDPWWNPASENQATDRAWRIGQTQPVFVYKLIARGTLEERIQQMQQRKGALADALLSPDAELAGGIDAADLQAIFGAPMP